MKGSKTYIHSYLESPQTDHHVSDQTNGSIDFKEGKKEEKEIIYVKALIAVTNMSSAVPSTAK